MTGRDILERIHAAIVASGAALLVGAAIATFAVSASRAAGDTSGEAAEGRQQAQMANPVLTLTASEMQGREVTNDEGEDLGTIRNVVVTEDNRVVAVVGVGGFLGVGQKTIAVPVEQLRMGDDTGLRLDITRSQLDAMPAFAQRDSAREVPAETSMAAAMSGASGSEKPASPQTAETPEEREGPDQPDR